MIHKSMSLNYELFSKPLHISGTRVEEKGDECGDEEGDEGAGEGQEQRDVMVMVTYPHEAVNRNPTPETILCPLLTLAGPLTLDSKT